MPTQAKKAWIAALHSSGLREIEVGSFVPARLVPQVADTAEVVAFARNLEGLSVMALVPNLRGAVDAIEAGAHRLTIPVSVSEAHSQANLRRSCTAMLAEIARIVAYRNTHAPQVAIEANLSTAFGCSIQGEIAEDEVLRLAQRLIEIGADAAGLSDTAGVANPRQVRRLFRSLRTALGLRCGAAHFHNTRGLGLANCLAAFEEGVRTFDSSQAGLGGCPFAPGASGNVITEDLVFMFEAMGVDTGIDLNALARAREILRAGLPNEQLHGMVAESGVPAWFKPARQSPQPARQRPQPARQRPQPAQQVSSPSEASTIQTLPLQGVRVLEFSHMVMGPTCGLVLADLGAEVIKIEPLEGDRTRRLLGSGAGFFPLFNRNKKSLAVDLHRPQGRALVEQLLAGADVVIENFKPGTMKRHELDETSLRSRHPQLIYASLKGFLPGPYAQRTALDEVVQMMGGLAYMTGRRGDPLRAGTSVNDIMGGMFAAIAILAALRARDASGVGQTVQSALFENNVFLVAQHMMQYAVTGKSVAPMPERISAWAVYDVFTAGDGEQIFLAVVSDSQWEIFCKAFDWPDLLNDPRLGSNNARVTQRDWLIPALRDCLAQYRAQELAVRFEAHGLPYAPITRPEELLEDPHLRESGGLVPLHLEDGREVHTVLLPILLAGHRPGARRDPPHLGQDSRALLEELGLSRNDVTALFDAGVVC
jgi:crotonobetainyl-CoA:carnitine CoA-transferase CaiB-like acyl-CoA transferase